MRFFHLSDLHIGKQLNGYSLRESQEQVLSQLIYYAEREKPDAILICGDIYDKSVPSGESHTVFDSFLKELSALDPSVSVFIIAGNHDSPERLNYASSFLERSRIYVSVMPPQTEGEYLRKVTLSDPWGKVNFYLFPFMKPGYVRMLPDFGDISGYDGAFRAVLERETFDLTERNVILAHQFFVNGSKSPELCESEQTILSVGGLDQIDIAALEDFDYAALGHIHGPQKVGSGQARYCGSPLKYSVSEEHHKKSVTMVTLEDKGKEAELTQLPLVMSRDVRTEKGKLQEIVSRSTEENCHDFVSITVTDEEEPVDMKDILDEVYDHILEIRIDNSRTRRKIEEDGSREEALNPLEAFSHFYEAVCHVSLTEKQENIMAQIVELSKGEG